MQLVDTLVRWRSHVLVHGTSPTKAQRHSTDVVVLAQEALQYAQRLLATRHTVMRNGMTPSSDGKHTNVTSGVGIPNDANLEGAHCSHSDVNE